MRKRLIAALLCASMAMPAAGEAEQIVKAAEQTTTTEQTTTAEQTTTTGENTSTGTETGNMPEEKAVSGTYGTNLKWEFDAEKGVLYITGEGNMKRAVEKQGKTDAPWQVWQDDIKEVVVGDDVTSIAKNVFAYLTNLEKVTIGKKVKKIHSTAFCKSQNLSTIEVADGNKYYCASNNILYNKKKTEILFLGNGKNNTCKIPASVKKINIDHTSPLLEKITVDSKNKVYSAKDGVLFNKKGTELLRCPNGRKGSYKVPAKVKTICEGAFAYCKKLEKITVADDTEEIKARVFEDCTGLIKVNLGKKVMIFDSWHSFDDRAPSTVADVFTNCTNLKEVNVSASNREYRTRDGVLIRKDDSNGDELLYYPPGREEKSYAIPKGIQDIGEKAFCKCDKLEALVFSNDDIEDIHAMAFQDCKTIKSVLVDSTLSADNLAAILKNCPNIENVSISENNKTIVEKDGVIYETSLNGMEVKGELVYIYKELEGDYVMPDIVQTIPYDSFANCSKLTSLKLSDSLNHIQSGNYGGGMYIATFEPENEKTNEAGSGNDDNQENYLPLPDLDGNYDGTVELDLSNCSSLKKIELGEKIEKFDYVILNDNIEEFVISEKNETLMAEDGIIYQKKEQKLNKCGGGKKGKVTVKEGTKEIAENAFSGCDEIEEIVLPDSIEKIGENAFKGCKNLKKIVLPENVKEIDIQTFYGCEALDDITIQSENLEWVAAWALKGISPNAIITVPKGKLEQYQQLLQKKRYQTGFTETMTIKEKE